MTVEEIFASICARMAKGIMIHNQLSNAFGFLNLHGYQRCHEYHYYEESRNYRELQNYYINEYLKLIPIQNIENVEVIPSNWFKHIQLDVDTNTKRKSIKELTEIWINWEKETKQTLTNYYKELFDMKEICAALKVKEFLEDVDNELMVAQKKYINLEAIGYDIVSIVEEQENLYKKYNKKIYKD